MSDAAIPMQTPAAGQWWVQVRGKAYGPYTMEQLTAFVAEGRVRPATPVSNSPDGAWIEARKVIGLTRALEPANDAAEAANVFVHAEIFSGSWNNFMAALTSLGHVCDLSPGLWLVRTRFSAGVIRNTLSQTLERGDRFVVVDATRDRLAWFNLGPETDVRIQKVWNGPLRVEAR
ncbi:MAG TPA: DUF4339 domain-containing protein [Vitreimonas sp.]|uniref:DUF4339 domain-containing protein n=1 Tax=Vitreimonas sp. TaxID=3069702 RepID=UPI002D721C0A|nr:DUF4339 domain-containing protein [Vitreimonas sp.]HYD86206.1 DUF4339 domain-containing protein [Vitreimonas sp.]